MEIKKEKLWIGKLKQQTLNDFHWFCFGDFI